ncbi:MAG: flagellar export chaperone FliS [Rhodocyclaceae bacterium]|nr:flagellar export chaperone FliS [Rhodocyclaceae bacterium]MCB1907772.1 flagellar export chaperone FliS [Rhodocyclaceae bacterium]
MFGQKSSAATAYARVGVETKVSTASPHQLIVMLYDGALLAINAAAVSMDSGDIPNKGKSISQAINIISNGLKASLDMDAGGEIAERLSALYDYMSQRLLHANLQNSRPALDEVSSLLNDLRDAWMQIADATAETT